MAYSRAPELVRIQKDPTHSANFGVKLQEKCKSRGVGFESNYGSSTKSNAVIAEYIIKTFKQ